jgi:hypothetical protein
MLTSRELYQIWAPSESIWSPWVAPAFFAQITCPDGVHISESTGIPAEWHESTADGKTVVILDLPGGDAIRWAMELARRGYRPVPLINGVPSGNPFIRGATNMVLDMTHIVDEICKNTGLLKELALPADAPPAFVLDANREIGTQALKEEMFDNRWMVFPQDFPSARFLRERGIRQSVLVRTAGSQPQEDLAHVLLRWQEASIQIFLKLVGSPEPPAEIVVERPSRFRQMWYRALALFGFRRNSVGGFGAFFTPYGSGG